MSSRLLKIGELAERTGLSVRALHHYEEIELLVPSHRTASNHRLYTVDDVARLQRIQSLRSLGFPLAEIARLLDDAKGSPLRTLEDHLARVREQIDLQRRIADRLEGLARVMQRAENVDMERLLETIEVMSMWEKKFSPEQMEGIRARGRELGEEKIREVEQAWATLIADLRAAMTNGVDPKSEEVQARMAKMRELTRMFSGGDAAIEGTLREAYKGGAGKPYGIDEALMAYMERAARD